MCKLDICPTRPQKSLFFARQPCVKMSCVFSGNCMFYIDSMRSETAQTHGVKLTKELIMFQFVGQP